MLLSMLLFAAGFAIAVIHKNSGIPAVAVILMVIAVFLLAAASFFVFLGITKGDFLEEEENSKSENT